MRNILAYINIKKTLLILFVLSLLFSCKYQPIFSAIEQEVKLKDFSVKGSIVGFAETSTAIYTANFSSVYKKSKPLSGNWVSIGSPGGGVMGIASDGTNIFAVGTEGGVKYYKNGWQSVNDGKNIKMIFGDKTIFGVDSESSPSKVYKITTTSVSPINSKQFNKEEYFIGAGGDYFATSEGLFKNDGNKADGCPSSVTAVTRAGDTGVFALSGSTVYYYDGNNLKSLNISKSGKSIFYLKEKTTLLVGCDKGYIEVKLDGNTTIDLAKAKEISPGSSESITDNPEQYVASIGSYTVDKIFAVYESHDKYSIFVGVAAGATQRNTGVWSYYSFDRNEWNHD